MFCVIPENLGRGGGCGFVLCLWDYRCMWKLVQQIRRDDLNNCPLKWLHPFPNWDQGSAVFLCSSVLSLCQNESDHLLLLDCDRTWLNCSCPCATGDSCTTPWGIYPLGELSRCSFNSFSWDLEIAFSSSYLFSKSHQEGKGRIVLN